MSRASGNIANGVIQAGQGIAKENYTWPFLAFSPRIGAAYDVSGTQKFVIRGNFGLFTDRPEGNHSVNQMGNPPFSTTATVRNATLQNLGANPVTTVPQLAIFQYDAALPTSTQWSTGFQMALPWASAIDVSYVGEHRYNLLTQFNQPIDINAPDFGAAYLAAESGSDSGGQLGAGSERGEHRSDAADPRLRCDQPAVADVLDRLPLDPDVVQSPVP